MYSRLPVWTAILAVLLAVLPTAFSRPTRRAEDPTTDPFYQPPAGFESQSPGTILRERQVNASFFGFIPDPVDAYQLLYRTTAVNGSAIATATTIFKPKSPKTDRFVSFHTAYDSSSPTCNPSYQYQLGVEQTGLISSVERLIIQVYLEKGYIVSSSDYEGPDAAFAAGRIEGMGVLDSMRAVSNYHEKLGLSSDSPAIVGTGYSGGAIATGWAAALHASYAPELNVKGWAQGGTPSNLTGTLLLLDDSPFSGFIPPAIDGLSKPSAYGAEVTPLIERIITEKGREALEFASTHCAVADLGNFFSQSLFSTEFQTLGPALLDDPTIQSVLNDNILGTKSDETPTVPVFVYHATYDEIIPYDDADRMVTSWCGNGASVAFTTYKSGGHATTEVIALPAVVEFVEAAFNGTVEEGCSEDTELDSLLDPLALGVSLEPLLVALLDALDVAGEKDANVQRDVRAWETTVPLQGV
ncbi:secretory lipase-domain-containing protein [Aspergillus lucknowensis]|uniref:Secretory lipase-domain-containing protein n=1 Tax=Aspergillus lucknowensis TaxID=176173 RepID=A0ABR4LRU5_9EURO